MPHPVDALGRLKFPRLLAASVTTEGNAIDSLVGDGTERSAIGHA
jgi:hypothetical protein